MPDEPIDWSAVWDNLDWSEERRDELLHQRARQYAAPLKEDEAAVGDAHTVLMFHLGKERYGIDASAVLAVRPVTRVTRVPGVPAFYRGVVNLRGKITTVLDLRYFFDMSVNDGDRTPRELVIARVSGLELGLLAHHVEDVIPVPKASLEPMDEMRFALGVTRDRLVVLDIAAIFAEERLIIGEIDE